MSEDVNAKAKDSFAIIVLTVGIVAFILWRFPEIYQASWWIVKKVEIEVLLLFSPFLGEEVTEAAYRIKLLLSEIPIGEFKFAGMLKTDQFTLPYIGWVFNVILIIIGWSIINYNLLKKFTKRHDIESLLDVTSKYWRFNRYLLKYNPSKDTKLNASNSESNFRFRDKPIDYLTKKEILTLVDKKYKINSSKLLSDSIEVIGKPFTGIDNLNKDELVVLAGLSLVASNKRFVRGFKGLLQTTPVLKSLPQVKMAASKRPMDLAVDLFGDMSECYNNERSFDEVIAHAKAILEITMESPEIKKIVSEHAYTSTLLRRMLIEARGKFGVISASIFGWIAINNRVLFVSMFDEGMAESSAEAYAIANHLRYEMLLKRGVYEIEIERHQSWIEMYLRRKGFSKLV